MDTIPGFDPLEYEKRNRRNTLIEDGHLHDVTKQAVKHGLEYKVSITNNLFRALYPYAEDANHGVSWDEIIYDVMKIFKKSFRKKFVRGDFAITTKTYIEKVISHDHILTFKDGNPRDKRIEIDLQWMPDEDLQPSLVMSLKDSRFF